MKKADLTKIYPEYYKAGEQSALIICGPTRYLSVRGSGDPSGSDFAQKIEALYTVAYTLKFMHKAMQSDFIVPKLEGLWGFDKARYQGLSMREAPLKIPRSEWQYRLLLRLPDFVNQKSVTVAIKKAMDKKKSRLVQDVVVFEMNEGKCVQVLHKGPFDTEPETLEKLELFIKENKLNMNGWHHEIYLSDFRKTPPEKLKTILREPVI